MNRADELLQQLDEEQRQAVLHGEGPLLVVAGAGSGKTRVLTYRIAHLVARGAARPHEILAVTFTNKAAREMVERVEALQGGGLRGGFVGTFHRFALQLLRRHPRESGLPERFAVADEGEQRQMVERVLKRLGIGTATLSPRAARARISGAKNAMVTPEELGRQSWPADTALLAEVMAGYQQELQAAGAVDFDDMLLRAVRLLAEEDGVRKSLQSRFTWILVDEYQDTNAAQARMVSLLGGARPNLTAVGDEDQSIYRWRGAEVANILEFEQTFPGARVVTLGRNYRSAEPILAAAAAVIARNTRRRPKQLTSMAGAGGPVELFPAHDDAEEARFVAEEIQSLRGRGAGGEVAVLFRINAQSRAIESELVRRALPYTMVGGTRFWERAEVRDATAYLRLLTMPEDALAFRRVVNVPARGIGAATMEHLELAAAERGDVLPLAARRLPDRLGPRARLALQGFFSLLDDLAVEAGRLPLPDLVAAVLDRSGLLAQYQSNDDEDRTRRANLDELVTAAAEAAERGQGLAEFLDEAALLSAADVEGRNDGVQLMTLHAAKGLEFDAVFLVGAEDGLLPLRRSGEETDPDSEEEERRLAYVGMTRARRRLVITHARLRRLHGEVRPSRPSPYLADLPADQVRWLRGGGAPDPEFHQQTTFAPPARRAAPGTAPAPAGSRRPTGSAHPDGWRPGLKVRHNTFGSGVILQVQGSGAQVRLVVYFDRAGRKTLIPSIAKLERA